MTKLYYIMIFMFSLIIFVNSGNISDKMDVATNQTDLKVGVFRSTESLDDVRPTFRIDSTTEKNLYINKYSYVPNGFENTGNVRNCQMQASCELLEEKTCLGAKLPYTHTSMALSGFANQQQARDSLNDLMSLQLIPRCWSVIQPFLCAILFPQCQSSNVQLPSQEMCFVTKGPCSIIEEYGKWPEFLLCKESYPSKCKTASMDLPFNTSGECASPLVSTKRDELWYDGFKGCGLQCHHPLFTEIEHMHFQEFSYLMALISVCTCSITVLTYLLDWRIANKYPAVIIFYINVCYLFAAVGFMLQFHNSLKSNITCHPDGTRRLNEPSDGNLSCVVTFVMVYYFLMAAGIWFVVLGYAIHMKYQSFVAGKCELKRESSYFHLIAWSLPVVLTITVMALAEVEGDPVVGICFLSTAIYVRVAFLLIPFAVMAVTGTFFIVKGLRRLVNVKLQCSHIISDNANRKIGFAIIRLSVFVVCIFLFLFTSIYFHAYTLIYEGGWVDSLKEFILCTSKIVKLNAYETECKVKSRPSLNVYKLHLFAFFGFGFIISSWFWTSNTVAVWIRLVRRIFGLHVEEGGHFSKREVIAQAFAKRRNLKTGGRISISLRSMHSDPAGLAFDMNSATDADMSSAWLAAIPNLMNRRGAVAGPSTFHKRRNSVGSEYSVKRRRLSMDSIGNSRLTSRRHSLDSQISFHVSDVERSVALHTAVRFGGRRKKHFLTSVKHRRFSLRKDRRASNTSDDSNLGSMIFGQLEPCANDSLFTTMMKMVNTKSYTDQDVDYRPTECQPRIASVIEKNDSLPIKATVAIQTSLESIEQPRSTMVEKGCQVSTPLLLRAAIEADLSGSNSSLSSYRTDKINV